MEQPCLHAMIVGEQGVGKSTLIRKVLQEVQVSLCGYVTRKEDGVRCPKLGDPIYIYEVGEPCRQTEDNLVGHSLDRKPVVYPEAFDRFAERLKKLPADAELILMDEIGVMEQRSEAFCKEVFRLLEGDRPIVAAIKYKDRPYLNQIRNHPRCRCFWIHDGNREELVEEVTAFVKAQLRGRQASCSPRQRTGKPMADAPVNES